MVQPAESRKGVNLAFTRGENFCSTTCWRVLRKSKMSAVLVIVERARSSYSHDCAGKTSFCLFLRAVHEEGRPGAASPSGAPPRYIRATVEEYPNAPWAQYLAAYPPRMYLSFDDPKQHALVTEFNNKVRSSQLARAPGQTAIPLYYKWPSGNCVITIDYSTPDENLEIVRAYLEKYPSSIP